MIGVNMRKDLKAEEMALRIRKLGRISGQGIEAFKGRKRSLEEGN
jgi:hypothetical protein